MQNRKDVELNVRPEQLWLDSNHGDEGRVPTGVNGGGDEHGRQAEPEQGSVQGQTAEHRSLQQ